MGRAEDLFAELTRDGESAIDRLIDDRQTENLWLDFKRSGNDGEGSKLHESDWKNLAKAISGFANSDGGVVVWGVDCPDDPNRGNLPVKKVAIKNPQRFVSWLEGAISGCTAPPHSGVEVIAIPSNSSAAEGYAATLIRSSQMTPHQCIKPAGTFQYYIRAGSSFVPTPHAVLAGLFGRRPQPHVFRLYHGEAKLTEVDQATALTLDAFIHVMNEGPGMAQHIFVSVILGAPGGPSQMTAEADPNQSGYWFKQMEFDIWCSAVTDDRFRLPPQMSVRAVRIQATLMPPFLSDYGLRIIVGCDGAPVEITDVSLTAEEVADEYDTAIRLFARRSPNATAKIFKTFLGASEETMV